ncbi:PQQ enzyme repeat-containing protein [Halovivax asiaticus JCM 14624]|uniref:PQQ enzyme repeat-containing protein n=1 Tax=Halovivax asiaticus JCM 14624 TaxID=1227490 RepID=M0BD15_9EURY|nr:PQQ-binding-like beta-propeller repeat protein [Halovivax asiaticus]ELZ08372.1 PQQ enzyme repeat-containing protein [Halovivax asiaticus JCM 14624]
MFANKSTVDSTPTEISPDWTVDLGMPVPTTAPRVLDDMVYVGTDTFVVGLALDGSDGRTRPLDDRAQFGRVPSIAATPAVDERAARLVVPLAIDGTAILCAVTPDDDIEWTQSLSGGLAFTPTIDGAGLAIQTTDAISVLGRNDGRIRWSKSVLAPDTRTEDATDRSPAMTDDRVFVPCKDGLRCFDREDGTEQWHTLDDPITATPAVGDELVYAPVADRGVRAIDRSSGRIEWKTEAFPCWTRPLVDGDRIYVAGERNLYAFDRTTGDRLWRFDEPGFGGPTYTSPQLVDDRIIAGSTGHAIVVFDRDRTRLARSTGTNTPRSHAIVGEHVLVAHWSGVSRYELP